MDDGIDKIGEALRKMQALTRQINARKMLLDAALSGYQGMVALGTADLVLEREKVRMALENYLDAVDGSKSLADEFMIPKR